MRNYSLLSNRFLDVISRFVFAPLGTGMPESILIYHVGNIGDIIVATPTYRAIRNAFPKISITLLTSPGRKGLPGAREIIQPLNLVDEIIIFYPDELTTAKKLFTFIKDLRRKRYDLLVYLPANQWGVRHLLRDMIFFRVAGIRCAVGFRVYEGYSLYEKYQQAPIGEVERLLQLIEPLGITASGYTPEFPLEPEDVHFASELLQRYGVGEDEVQIVVHPGGKKPTKLWPLSNFISLIDILIKDTGARIILVGSADEVGMANTIEAQVKKEIINITGTHSLTQLAAVIKKADLMVSNDSGPMHIAAAVGTPVVALFSGVDIPHVWYPFGDIHRVIRKEVNCSPCFRNECDEHRCMVEISVEEVLQAVRELLKKGRGKRTEGEVVKGTELKS